MALAATTIWEVRTGGSDTANGGAFDPGQTAGMNTDGAATSATGASPVFTSASYNFVAGDVGAWVYIASGTNWTPGWYKIASVASNQATLSAAAGAAVLAGGTPTTAAGCATTASPTGATWSVDYSQQDAARNAYTDLASTGAGLTVTSAAKPFGKQQVGNALVVTSGTNFTAGRYVIASIAGVTATVLGAGNITTGVGASGVGGLGGGLATPGKAGGVQVAGNGIWFQTGTYSITTASVNVANGPIKDVVGGIDRLQPIRWEGYQTVRGDRPTRNNRPLFQLQASLTGSAITIIDYAGAALKFTILRYVNVDGNTGNAAVTGVNGTTNHQLFQHLYIRRTTTQGLTIGDQYCRGEDIEISEFSGTAAIGFANGADITSLLNRITIHDGTGGDGIKGYQFACNFSNILIYNVAGTGSFAQPSYGMLVDNNSVLQNCTVYNAAGQGITIIDRPAVPMTLINCLSYGNGGFGFQTNQVEGLRTQLINCAGGSNGSGNYDTTQLGASYVENFVALTADPFTNKASGDFSLNTTAGGGAALRAAGAPGVMGTTTTGYADIGAVQHPDSGVAGGGLLVHPGMTGGPRG